MNWRIAPDRGYRISITAVRIEFLSTFNSDGLHADRIIRAFIFFFTFSLQTKISRREKFRTATFQIQICRHHH